MLGGMGAGLTGGSNQVLDMLNKMVDRDIDAQLQEIGKGKTLLDQNMRQYGNARDAMDATRLQINTLLQSQIEQSKSKFASPIAQSKATQAIGLLETQAAPLKAQLAARQALSKAASSSAPPGQLQSALQQLVVSDPETGERYMKKFVPHLGQIAKDEKSAQEVIEKGPELEEFGKVLGKLRKIAIEAGNTGIWNPKSVAEARNLATTANELYRRSGGLGVYKESEAHYIDSLLGGDPTKMGGAIRYLPVLNTQIELFNKKRDMFYKSHGVKAPLNSTGASPMGAGAGYKDKK